MVSLKVARRPGYIYHSAESEYRIATSGETEEMKAAAILSILPVCLCVSTVSGQGESRAGKYAPEPVSIGYALKAVPLHEVTLEDGFWGRRMKTHMEVTIPHVLNTLQIDYADPQPSRSALALVRTLEGAAYCLMMKDDPKLQSMLDKICSNVGDRCHEGDRWFGGCPEAAVYHYFATGKASSWLSEAEEEYRRRKDEYFDADGKPIKEPEPHAYYGMAIVSLYRATGDEFYRDLARKFMDIRGMPATRQRLWPKFAAQHQPVSKMNEPGGHAGSFGWFASALVDVGALTGDPKYGQAAQRIWQNLVDTRICITGGTGAVSRWEGFGEPYAIGRRGYNETCAATGTVFYNHRLFLLTRDAKYFDVMEVVLLNGLLSGVSLSGDEFFYTNVLESGGGTARLPDRRVPCCHGSICRTIPQVPGYMYAHTANDVYVTLYAANRAEIPLNDGKVRIEQETEYPFDGKIVFTVSPAAEGQRFRLRLRIPTWARGRFMPGALYSFTSPPARTWEIKVNGEVVKTKVDKGFAVIDRSWNPGDQVQLDLPMPVRVSTCIDKVEAYRGRVVITRGPLVYCAEEVDNNGPVHRLAIPELPNADQIEVHEIPDGVLNGVRLISLPGVERIDGKEEPISINLVPYYTWANRGNKSMAVWIPQGPVKLADPLKWIPATGAKPPKSPYGEETEMIFENKSGQPVKVYWVSYRGELKLYFELAPGETRNQRTYVANAWQITDENDKPLGHFIAGPSPAPAVIPRKR